MRSQPIVVTLSLLLLVSGCPGSGDGSSSSTGTSADTGGGTAGSDTGVAPGDAAADGAQAEDAADDAAGPIDAGTEDGAGPDDLLTPDDTAPDTAPVPDNGPPIPDPDVTAPFSNCSEPGGDRNIYDLQDPKCPDHISPEPIGQSAGVTVTLTGVIVTGRYPDTFFVQEPAGGPYSGIAVFSHGLPTSDLAPGDIVTVTGSYFEFFDNSELGLDTYEKTGTTDPPEPFDVVHPSHIATGGPVAEMFEGVLVRVHDVETIHTKPDCPNEFGEFMVTGGLRVDDMALHWDARLGDRFSSITGPMNYAFGNRKVEPRTIADLAWIEKGSQGSSSKCINTECQVPIDQPGTKALVINEVMPDPYGEDAGQEWVEIHNPGSAPIDMNGWELRDCTGQKVPLVGNALVVPAKAYLMLGMNANPQTNGDVPIDHPYGSAFSLPNSLGSLLLFDGTGVGAKLVDQIRFSRFDPWKVFQVGHSLERVSPTSNGTVPEGWKTGSTVYGTSPNFGSPGKKNDLK